jgi:hypothetical protein
MGDTSNANTNTNMNTNTDAQASLDRQNPITPQSDNLLNIAFMEKMAERRAQDEMFRATTKPTAIRESLNKLYSGILGKSPVNSKPADMKSYMLKRLYDGPLDLQGKHIKVPIDFHKGPYMDPDDAYTVIYGAESNISNNCNTKLLKPINDTGVSHGMKAYAEGVMWNNGLICYNKNSIVIREEDNVYGQASPASY